VAGIKKIRIGSFEGTGCSIKRHGRVSALSVSATMYIYASRRVPSI